MNRPASHPPLQLNRKEEEGVPGKTDWYGGKGGVMLSPLFFPEEKKGVGGFLFYQTSKTGSTQHQHSMNPILPSLFSPWRSPEGVQRTRRKTTIVPGVKKKEQSRLAGSRKKRGATKDQLEEGGRADLVLTVRNRRTRRDAKKDDLLLRPTGREDSASSRRPGQ